jgi:hypothetical protein
MDPATEPPLAMAVCAVDHEPLETSESEVTAALV